MASNYCPRCGAKIIPEQKFCHDCGELLTTTNIPANGSLKRSKDLSATARPSAYPTARVLGIIGGVLGALIGAFFLVVLLFFDIPYYYAGYYSENAGPWLLSLLVISFAILGFSIIGALGAAQKLDARPKVNAGALFVAGIVVLLILLSMAFGSAGGDTTNFSFSAVFGSAGLVIGVLFFISGFLILREPAS